ncbi:MAG: hypothetical protein PWP10_3912 [Clostridiales bacterium]|jgi:transposase InsO family protein|nr:hypothetical protein [Clostridiales bacterium]
MGVSKSGFYKWKNREVDSRNSTRSHVVAIVEEVHKKHRSHGYRWVKHYIRINYKEEYSDNYIYRAFHYLDIKAETKHRVKQRRRIIKDKYPNLIFSTWETVDRARQVIVSDMTAFTVYQVYYELTLYFDVFNKEIISWRLTDHRGNRDQYIDGLKDIVALLEGLDRDQPTVIHTDQGSVYASTAYNELLKDINVQRSMSRAGKPTDNPVNESLNGWIKEELFMDFALSTSKDVNQTISEYVDYYNNQRPCYSIGYDTPRHYYLRYINGELEKKDTFAHRFLTEEPKYIQRRKLESLKKKPKE